MSQRFSVISRRFVGAGAALFVLAGVLLVPQDAQAAGAAPTCTSSLGVSTPSRVAVTIDVAKLCTDPQGRALTFGAPTLAKGSGTISGANGVYTYTSNDLFMGSDQLIVPVSNPDATASVSIMISAQQNSADPVCHLATAYAVYGGSDTASGRIVCDTDAAVTFRALPRAGKQVGTLNLHADGTFTWKAPAVLPAIPGTGFGYAVSNGAFEQSFGASIYLYDADHGPVTRAKVGQSLRDAIHGISVAPGTVVCVSLCDITTTFTLAGPAAKALGLAKRAVPVTIARSVAKQGKPTGEWAAYYDDESFMNRAVAAMPKSVGAKLAKSKKPVTLTETVVVDDKNGPRKITRLVVLRP